MSPFVPLQQNPFPPLHSTSMAQALPHSIMYPAGQQQMHYLPQYYSTPYAQYAPSSYPERTLKAERRRPKYTRSKTGCLTCRKKKVKCDETKPSCQRCCSSQLDCTWPEIPPPKKKAPSRKGRSPADHDYSTTTSEAGTSSQSPTEAGDAGDGTPQPTFRSEAPSPSSEIEREGASAAASTGSLAFADPNMLQVGNGAVSGDRRHSEPHLLPSLAASAMETRRHSMADITDGQHYMHHSSHHHQQHQGHIHNQSISSAANGALGLSLNQLGVGSSTRPSTPSDFLYPHSQIHGAQQGYPAFTPAGNVAIIPNISGGSTSSRPSTAGSSLSFSHSLRRTPAGGSRPSTAGSHVSAYVHHRPASSGSGTGTGTGDYPPLGYSPFQFQQPGRDVSLDAVNVMNGGYANAGISRPSTANSAPSAAPSPYMRHGVIPLGDGSTAANGMGGMGRWQESPLLAQPQPHTVDGMGTGGYFNQLMPSPPQHARTDSPAWAY